MLAVQDLAHGQHMARRARAHDQAGPKLPAARTQHKAQGGAQARLHLELADKVIRVTLEHIQRRQRICRQEDQLRLRAREAQVSEKAQILLPRLPVGNIRQHNVVVRTSAVGRHRLRRVEFIHARAHPIGVQLPAEDLSRRVPPDRAGVHDTYVQYFGHL